MTDKERREIKAALLQCAKENENRNYSTFHIVVSSICRSAKERIEELEQQVEKMKCCVNLFFEHEDEKYYMDDIVWWKEIVLPKEIVE